jgi:hypothetical protein
MYNTKASNKKSSLVGALTFCLFFKWVAGGILHRDSILICINTSSGGFQDIRLKTGHQIIVVKQKAIQRYPASGLLT